MRRSGFDPDHETFRRMVRDYLARVAADSIAGLVAHHRCGWSESRRRGPHDQGRVTPAPAGPE